jgi:hypothetical protein
VKRPLPQPAAVAFAIEADGFVARVKASLLTVMFPKQRCGRTLARKDGKSIKGLISALTFADSFWPFKSRIHQLVILS